MTVNTVPKIDFDKFKEIMKELTLKDMLPVALSTVEFLKDFGEFLIAIGNLQKKSEKASDILFKIGEEPGAFLALLVDKIPEDKLKPLVELSLRLSSLQTRLKDFKNLSVEEKILSGKEFKKIANEMSKMLKRVEQ